jgi:hypothetical protein
MLKKCLLQKVSDTKYNFLVPLVKKRYTDRDRGVKYKLLLTTKYLIGKEGGTMGEKEIKLTQLTQNAG